MDVWSELAALTNIPYYERLKKWKGETGKKIIGCCGLHVPEEMIHALGMLPVVLFSGPEPVTLGDLHWQAYMCGPVRGITDLACKGKLDFLDGMVIHDCCHEIRGMADIIKLNAPNIGPVIKPMWFPKMLKRRQTKPRILEELVIYKDWLEQIADRKLTTESLQQSIRVYNENRSLLMKLFNLRRTRHGILSAKQIQNIVTAGMQMSKEEHNDLLKSLLVELESKETSENASVNIILHGSLCNEVPLDILGIIEQVGGTVVDDDLYTGSRYFVTMAPEPADPFEALAERYINMVAPCPSTQDPSNDLGRYLVNMVSSNNQDGFTGVINIITKSCECHCHIYPWIRYALRDAEIPELVLEIEHSTTSFASVKTRIQTFVEMIRGV